MDQVPHTCVCAPVCDLYNLQRPCHRGKWYKGKLKEKMKLKYLPIVAGIVGVETGRLTSSLWCTKSISTGLEVEGLTVAARLALTPVTAAEAAGRGYTRAAWLQPDVEAGAHTACVVTKSWFYVVLCIADRTFRFWRSSSFYFLQLIWENDSIRGWKCLNIVLTNSMIYKIRKFSTTLTRVLHNPCPGRNQSNFPYKQFFSLIPSNIFLPSML